MLATITIEDLQGVRFLKLINGGWRIEYQVGKKWHCIHDPAPFRIVTDGCTFLDLKGTWLTRPWKFTLASKGFELQWEPGLTSMPPPPGKESIPTPAASKSGRMKRLPPHMAHAEAGTQKRLIRITPSSSRWPGWRL